MNKKILMGLGAALAVVASVAAMSAYEAHVINVTAHIENALNVHPDDGSIEFGTMFPQEYDWRSITVLLSESFKAQQEAWGVDYKIVQKDKCWDWLTYPDGDPAEINYEPVNYWDDLCPEGFIKMPSLCDFLSKLPVMEEAGDIGVLSYYVEDGNGDYCTAKPAVGSLHPIAYGTLTNSTDIMDEWYIDLKVPPFAGFVGQDWPETCKDWVLDGDPDGSDFGCDLWIEVTDILRK